MRARVADRNFRGLPTTSGYDDDPAGKSFRSKSREGVARPIVLAMVGVALFGLVMWQLATWLAGEPETDHMQPHGDNSIANKRVQNAFLSMLGGEDGKGKAKKGPQVLLADAVSVLSARVDVAPGLVVSIPVAGLPRFPRVFARDTLMAGLLMNDPDTLFNILRIATELQGKTRDPITGEEPGKIFHEWPGVSLQNGKSTLYSACDTTLLYIIGMHRLALLSGDEELDAERERMDFVKQHTDNVRAALAYLRTHLNSMDLFFEDPALANATEFALKVTYWKDSRLPSRTVPWKNGETIVSDAPLYPIVYTLTHAMAIAAVRSAAALLTDESLTTLAATMVKALGHLEDRETVIQEDVDSETGLYLIGRDAGGLIRGVSSDSLHALYFLNPEDIPETLFRDMDEATRALETDIGYMTSVESGGSGLAADAGDQYHINTVWPFEQAIINVAATRHHLSRVAAVSRRIVIVLARMHSRTYANLVGVPSNSVQRPTLTIDKSRPNLPLSAGDAWTDYFFPELLRHLPDGKASEAPLLWPGHPEMYKGRLAGMETAGHQLVPTNRHGAFGTAGCTIQLWTVAACVYFNVLAYGEPFRQAGGVKLTKQQVEDQVYRRWPTYKSVLLSLTTPDSKQIGDRKLTGVDSLLRCTRNSRPLGVAATPPFTGRFLHVALLQCCNGAVKPGGALRGPQNVDDATWPVYDSPKVQFKCGGLDTGASIPCSAVNDDFCDCPDGSDEPGTSACAHLSPNPAVPGFFCDSGVAEWPASSSKLKSINRRIDDSHIPSSMVQDGVCDCCDGADEGFQCTEAPVCRHV